MVTLNKKQLAEDVKNLSMKELVTKYGLSPASLKRAMKAIGIESKPKVQAAKFVFEDDCCEGEDCCKSIGIATPNYELSTEQVYENTQYGSPFDESQPTNFQ